jgi:hypothetical protein
VLGSTCDTDSTNDYMLAKKSKTYAHGSRSQGFLGGTYTLGIQSLLSEPQSDVVEEEMSTARSAQTKITLSEHSFICMSSLGYLWATQQGFVWDSRVSVAVLATRIAIELTNATFRLRASSLVSAQYLRGTLAVPNQSVPSDQRTSTEDCKEGKQSQCSSCTWELSHSFDCGVCLK